MIDGREGVTSLDRFFSKWLRKQCHTTKRLVDPNTGKVTYVTQKKPVVLLANKCDNFEHASNYFGLTEGYELGFGEPIPISADHSSGLSDLHNGIYEAFLKVHETKVTEFTSRERAINAEVEQLANMHEIKLAVVGKVNTGKSSLINTLLGHTRVLTGSQPGVTRDPIEIDWRDEKEEKRELKKRQQRMKEEAEEEEEMMAQQQQQSSSNTKTKLNDSTAVEPAVPIYRFTLVDTAGLKGVTAHAHSKYSRVDELSMTWSLRSIERANVVALMVDITEAGMEGVMKGDKNMVTSELTSAQKKKLIREEEKLKRRPEPLRPKNVITTTTTTPSNDDEGDASTSSSSTVSSTPMIPPSGILFKPGKKYTEEERGYLLRTYVRNVFSSDDLAIAAKILEEGRGLLILLNKFDQVPTPELRDQILEGVRRELDVSLSLAGAGVPILGISGRNHYDSLRGQSLKTTIRSEVTRIYERWTTRLNTHRLNSFLRELLKVQPPPSLPSSASGQRPKKIQLKFIQQVSVSPPAFVVFSNAPGGSLSEEYKRFLINAIRKEFDLIGVPVRLYVRVRKNPYATTADRLKAKQKAASQDAPLTSFAADEDADVDDEVDDDDGEFNESDYAPLSDAEVKFDYDGDMFAASNTREGQEELRREKRQRGNGRVVDAEFESATPTPAEPLTAAAAAAAAIAAGSSKPRVKPRMPVVTDSPIPRVSPTGKNRPVSTPRRPRMNTSNLFASSRTVSKPRQSIQAAFKWSVSSSTSSKSAATRGAYIPGSKKVEYKKPFGTKRSKKSKKMNDTNVQSSSVLRSTEKADAAMAARKAATKGRKLAAKIRKSNARKK